MIGQRKKCERREYFKIGLDGYLFCLRFKVPAQKKKNLRKPAGRRNNTNCWRKQDRGHLSISVLLYHTMVCCGEHIFHFNASKIK